MNINTPISDNDISKLKAGDQCYLTGTIYIARDLAHRRLIEMMARTEQLPFEIKGQIIFYAGPTPGKNSLVSAIGPTTASRMDPFLEPLLKLGLKATVGKGPRSKTAKELFKKYKAIYFIATGGTAALLGLTVKKAEMTAFPELGPEAVLKLEVSNFPVIVAYDAHGGDLFEEGRKKFEIQD